MENASKALLIAGGILLALMTLSLVVYMSGATSRMMEAQDEKKAAEELAAFNMEYEAYNKRRMYGTDIITVVNKAINYNIGVTQNEAITIKITTMEPFQATVQSVKQYIDESGKKPEIIKTEYPKVWNLPINTYEIGYNPPGNIVSFFTGQEMEDTNIVKEEKSNYIIREITYSALTNFKRAIFECTRCEDTDNDGRIDIMEFTQYNRSYETYY